MSAEVSQLLLRGGALTLTCPEKHRLLNAYRYAVNEYARAVTFLHREVGGLSRSDYESIQRGCEDARLRSEQTRRELAEHCDSHGC